jgi:MFS family permease
MKARPGASASAVLWIIPAVYFVFVAAEFALMTHMALQVTAAGRSAFAVGLLASALWLGILLASTRAHRLVQRHGHARVFVGASALSVLATLSAALHGHYAGWLAGALVLGLGGGLVWVAGEAWLAEAAPADRRGFFVGLFETSVGLGLMAGPALVPLMRWLGQPVPWASVALMVLALAASVALLRADAPGSDEGPSEDASAAVAPVAWRALAIPLAGVAALSGLMEGGVASLLPSISMRLGFSIEAAAWLGTVIGAGSALLQVPAGQLADRAGVRGTTLLAWLVVLLANGGLWLTAAAPAPSPVVLWAVGFALGGAGGAVYTLIIIQLGHQLSGGGLVRAIGWLVTAYAVGTAIGPAAGGAVFDGFGLAGLATLLLLLSVLGLAITWRALGGSPAPGGTGSPGGGKAAAGSRRL